MASELQDIFAQGDAELHKTAGEPATLIRKNGGARVDLRIVISAADTQIELPTATGAGVQCVREASIRCVDLARKPEIGDKLEAGGKLYRIQSVTGWAYDTSWHVDLSLIRK